MRDAHADTDRYANPHADPHTDKYCDGHSNQNTYEDTDRHANAYADPYAYLDEDADLHSYCNSTALGSLAQNENTINARA